MDATADSQPQSTDSLRQSFTNSGAITSAVNYKATISTFFPKTTNGTAPETPSSATTPSLGALPSSSSSPVGGVDTGEWQDNKGTLAAFTALMGTTKA